MKKPTLRRERLFELTETQLAGLAGALPNAGSSRCTIIVSNDSCVCGFDAGCNVEISNGSCVCNLLHDSVVICGTAV